MGWQGVLRKNIVGDDILIVPSNHAGTDRRRVKDAAPYGGDGKLFDIQGAAARGCNEYEVLATPLVDGPIKFETSRAARQQLPTTTSPPANTTPVLRDVRRAIKIFSYTVHGAFFFISEKEWGVQSRTGNRCKIVGRAEVVLPHERIVEHRRGGCPHPPYPPRSARCDILRNALLLIFGGNAILL